MFKSPLKKQPSDNGAFPQEAASPDHDNQSNQAPALDLAAAALAGHAPRIVIGLDEALFDVEAALLRWHVLGADMVFGGPLGRELQSAALLPPLGLNTYGLSQMQDLGE